MDEQVQQLLRVLQGEEVPDPLPEPTIQFTDLQDGEYTDKSDKRVDNFPVDDGGDPQVLLQEIYHTSRFLQAQGPTSGGFVGFNITRYSVLNVIQNPYMCSLCGAIYSLCKGLAEHIKTTHDPETASGKEAKAGISGDEEHPLKEKKGRREENKENAGSDEVDYLVGSKQAVVTGNDSDDRPKRSRRLPQRFVDDDLENDSQEMSEELNGTSQNNAGEFDAEISLRYDPPFGQNSDKYGSSSQPPGPKKTRKQTDGVDGVKSMSYPCEFCDMTFSNKKYRYYHHLKDHADSIFKCNVCDKEYSLQKHWLFKRHCQGHTRPNKRKLPRQPGEELSCDICGTTVANASCLSVHKQNLHPEMVNIEKPFTCEECGKMFRTKYLLKSHRDLVHTDLKPFACNICGSRFKIKQYLDIHSRIHSGERPFSCRVCGQNFSSSSAKRKHEHSHSNTKPYKCNQCQRAYSSKIAMREHVTAAHTQERPLMCEICGKTFIHRASLRQHNLLHTGQKPYICGFCEHAFSQKANLQDHVRCIHTHEKPYRCDLCNMTFTRSTGRRDHMRKQHNSQFVSSGSGALENFHTQPVEEVEISGTEVEF